VVFCRGAWTASESDRPHISDSQSGRNVIRDVLKGEQQVSPLVILHLWSESGLFGPQQFLLRPVTQCWISDSSDAALGAAAQMTDSTGVPLAHWCWPLSWESPTVGSACATYAFPNHSIVATSTVQVIRILPDLYDGEILKVADYRDSVMVPHPYLEVSAHVHHAASGGPVAIPGKGVVGINCTYLDPHGPGVATQIRCLQDAFLDHVILGNETVGRRVAFSELVAAGAVTMAGYRDRAAPNGSGRIVRLDLVPSSTRLVIETTISS
jgi:hypothetical protein